MSLVESRMQGNEHALVSAAVYADELHHDFLLCERLVKRLKWRTSEDQIGAKIMSPRINVINIFGGV